MKYIFKHSSTFEMGRSVHHHLIYFMLKKTFQKGEPNFTNTAAHTSTNNSKMQLFIRIFQ